MDHIKMNKTSNFSTNYTTHHLKCNYRVYNRVQGAIKIQRRKKLLLLEELLKAPLSWALNGN